MISLYSGAVRGQNKSKYDLLRSPRERVCLYSALPQTVNTQ